MTRELTEDEKTQAYDMLARARAAQSQIEDWSQDQLDRLSQAIASATSNRFRGHIENRSSELASE